VLSFLPFTFLSDGLCCLSFQDRQHKPSERRVNGKTDNIMAIRKRVNGRTDNTMATRKKGKWKNRQHKPPERRVNGRTDNTSHQKEG
jgi:hypothetical protein